MSSKHIKGKCNYCKVDQSYCNQDIFQEDKCFWHCNVTKNPENIKRYLSKDFDIINYLEGLESLEGFNIQKAILHKADLSNKNFTKTDLSFAQMSGVKLEGSNFSGTKCDRTNLTHANLKKIHLECPYVYDTPWKILRGLPHLTKFSDFTECELGYSNFENANLQRAKFEKSDLSHVNFKKAKMAESLLGKANLNNANLNSTDLRGADLRGANIAQVNYNKRTKFHFTLISNIEWNMNPLLKRFIEDQNFLYAFKKKNIISKIVYYLWLITSNCGRSILLWSAWSVLIAIFFGFLFQQNINWFYIKSVTLLTPYYFSIITFTTLGFGDVTPITLIGQFWVMIEVVLGYIMLGGLISIFANKLSRRA